MFFHCMLCTTLATQELCLYVCGRAAMRRGTATLLIASMFLAYTALFAWRANLDLSNQLFYGVVSISLDTAIEHTHRGWNSSILTS